MRVWLLLGRKPSHNWFYGDLNACARVLCFHVHILVLQCIPSVLYVLTAVSIRWTGLGTGLWDWTEGLDSRKVALIQFRSRTHYYTTVYLHHMNWIQGRRPSLDINIDRTRRRFSSHFCRCRAIQVCKPISTGHYPTAALLYTDLEQ